MAIAALVLWLLTAGAGVSLLRSGRASRGAAASPAEPAGVTADPVQPVDAAGDAARTAGPVGGPARTAGTVGGPARTAGTVGGAAQKAGAAGLVQTHGAPAAPAPPAGPPARYAAVPLTEDGRPPPVPRAKVAAPPGEHPLLQFSHPALALIGSGFWLAFVLTHYRPLAWISFGVLVVTLGAGLSWLTANTLAARHRRGAARAFHPRLIGLHGLAAATTLALTVLAALSAGHG